MPNLNLYLLSQTQCTGYDSWDSCVVAATTSWQAKKIHPAGWHCIWPAWKDKHYADWAINPRAVKSKFLGKAKRGTKPGVICSSFNAG